MRTPSTAIRGVFVILIVLGVVFVSNIGIFQTRSAELLQAELTPSPSPTATPNPYHYFPVINNYRILESSVALANGQGFDNCKPLSVQGMQTWWDHSPYSAVNIYLGGISAWCPFDQLTLDWYAQVAAQGWSFILTWAGPQSPHGCPADCKFKYPMSSDPGIAYVQGKIEALAAVETAENAGFKGQLVIYYDVESYSGASVQTRETVASFIEGWTEQLQDLGHVAGAYGAACTSYIVDWAFNDPPLDEVWIAQWNKVYKYDPAATVYNTTCLDNPGQPPIFWVYNQRLKQYTGPHNETWGGVTLNIDSDVLDGAVNILTEQATIKNLQPVNPAQPQPHVSTSNSPGLSDFQLLSASTGWVLQDNQLLLTQDAGLNWQDISPATGLPNTILAVHFNDPVQGWAAIRIFGENGTPSLSIYRTSDAGQTWFEIPLNRFNGSEVWEIETGQFEFLDSQKGWLALNLLSGNNFSFGRLLTTEDGGLTWEELELPLGEPVVFLDSLYGWTAGGPRDQVYYTDDGGRSWTLSENTSVDAIKTLSSGDQQLLAGKLPQDAVAFEMLDRQFAWAVVQQGSCTGYKPRAGEPFPSGEKPLQCAMSTRLVKTEDGGLSWADITLPE